MSLLLRPFQTLLIANRGEIVARIARSARALGLRTVAVCSDADRDAPFLAHCDQVLAIGGQRPVDSYLRGDKLLEAARASGAQAIHPGYGFLSENAVFAQSVLDAGLVWVGPPPDAMAAMGDKASARRRMQDAGVPVLPGTREASDDLAHLQQEAQALGLPLMVKASAGGGGRGMRLVTEWAHLPEALQAAQAEACVAFGDGRLLLERALLAPRHVEVQVLADGHGTVLHLGERECSVQRRHQKLIEEAPSPAVGPALRRRMGQVAVQVARAAGAQGHVGAGTVEFLLDTDGRFWFMEMNTRLQVEHPVTECLTGLDLVAWPLRIAMGASLDLQQDEVLQRYEKAGHAVEARLCAEDPAQQHLPQAGTLWHWQAPSGLRVDAALRAGQTISPFYDSMLGKLIAHGPDRTSAVQQLAQGLAQTQALGLPTNRVFLARVLSHPRFVQGDLSTAFLAEHGADLLPACPSPAPQWSALAAVALAACPAQTLPPMWRGWTSAALTVQQLPLLVGTQRQVWTLENQGQQWTATQGEHRLVFEQVDLDGPHGLRAVLEGVPIHAHWHRQGTQFCLQSGLDELRGEDLRLHAAQRTQSARSGDVHAPCMGASCASKCSPASLCRRARRCW